MTRKNFIIKPDHLELGKVDPEKQELMNRINRRRPFYMYPQAKSIIKAEMFPLFHEAVDNNTSRDKILFLYGDYNTGKSYLLLYIKELIRTKYQDIWKPGHHPILTMDFRDEINTAKEFYLFLLNELKAPVDPNRLRAWKLSKTVEINLRELVILTLEELGTRILIFDESQRLVKGRNQDIPDIFKALKDLTNKKYWSGDLCTQLVLCGTDDAYTALSGEKWIQDMIHAIRLEVLKKPEYSEFLWLIYRDYIELGISDDWDLANIEEGTGEAKLNSKFVQFLYEISKGKVGLTVEIIKDAIKRALHSNRLHPILEDYKRNML